MYEIFTSFEIARYKVEHILVYFHKTYGQNGAGLLVIKIEML